MLKFSRSKLKREVRDKIGWDFLSLYAANLLVQILIAVGVLFRDIPIVVIIIFLITSVLEFGLASFYINYYYNKELNYRLILISYKGTKRFLRHLLTFIAKYIIILLSATLLIIPALIKRYAYSQIKYIRADKPDLSPLKCLLLSRRMMRGHKIELFLIELSFILWIPFIPISGGLILLYFLPYYSLTMAGYHDYLKKKYEEDRDIMRGLFAYFVKCLYKIN